MIDLVVYEFWRKVIVECGDGLVLDWFLKVVGGFRCDILVFFCIVIYIVRMLE